MLISAPKPNLHIMAGDDIFILDTHTHTHTLTPSVNETRMCKSWLPRPISHKKSNKHFTLLTQLFLYLYFVFDEYTCKYCISSNKTIGSYKKPDGIECSNM